MTTRSAGWWYAAYFFPGDRSHIGGHGVLAEWRDEIGALRIGAVSERGVSASLARLEPFRLAIAEKLDTDVELFPARDYPVLIDALADGRLDYAVLSAVAYAAAYNHCECVEPLVIAANGAGQTAFRQIVLTRSDRPASLQARSPIRAK